MTVDEIPTPTPVPEHIEPRSLLNMQSDEIDHLLDTIRARRLRAAQIYAETQAIKKAASDERSKLTLQKHCDLLAKDIEAVTKKVEKMEERVLKIRALRLELGIE